MQFKVRFQTQILSTNLSKVGSAKAILRDVEVAVRTLLNAKAPVFYVGDGVLQANACKELLEFVEITKVPVITSIKGKSAFPENHPLSLGMRGRALWMCISQS